MDFLSRLPRPLIVVFLCSVVAMAAFGYWYYAKSLTTLDAFSYRGGPVPSDFGYLDFLCFSMVTWACMGYADIAPANTQMRCATALECLLGIVCFVFAVAYVGITYRGSQPTLGEKTK